VPSRLAPFLACLVAAAAVAPPAPAQDPAADPKNLLLRLGDVPPGYQVGDDSGCGMTLSDEGAPRELARLQAEHPQENCGIQLERVWVTEDGPTGPPRVESYAFVFATAKGANAAFEVRHRLAAYMLGLRPRKLHEVAPLRPVGEAAAAYETDDALGVTGIPGRPGVAFLWRSGRVLSVVFGVGTVRQEAAMVLAEVQQRRIEQPTTLRPSENDDREVPLGDPRLRGRVYWLGRRFDPSGRLPAIALSDVFGGARPGWLLNIEYRKGVTLSLWTPRAWRRFAGSQLGQRSLEQPCGHSRGMRVPRGRAVVVAGYERRRGRCDGRPRDLFVAHVHLRDVVVAVNVPWCFLCFEAGRSGPYDSLAGIRAVVRGLRPHT
jgi:hypothetical protein